MYFARVAMVLVSILVFAVASASAQDDEPVILRGAGPPHSVARWESIADGFDKPVYVTHANDGSGRLFVVEQCGKIFIVRDGARASQLFLDISDLLKPGEYPCGHFHEMGLLGLAFHPEFATNGLLFVSYTVGRDLSVIERYQVSADNPDSVDVNSGQVIFQVAQPFETHNNGHLAFGPDGYLYIGLGDGGHVGDPLGAGQNLQIILGTILRVDVDSGLPYAIPPDNPFVDNQNALDEIWAYGLRNPWRFSFDRATGDLYIGDVGEGLREEVNFQPSASAGGENYGWNVWEGNVEYAGGEAPGYVPPVFAYGNNHGCAIIGGYVYRGKSIPEYSGVYIMGDFCSGTIWAVWRDWGGYWRAQEQFNSDFAISSFGEDESGELLLVDRGGGTIYRLVLRNTSDVPLTLESAPSAAAISLTPIASGFNRPVYLTHAGDNTQRLFLVEQSGKIWILNDGARSAQPFLDVSRMISPSALGTGFTEQGLLGLAFHPEYESNGTFFVNMTDRTGETVVARYRVAADNPFIADVNSGQVIFRQAQPYSNHNGGHIDFGPDGYLYIALGDGGSANDPLGAGQNLGLLLGTILRIDVDGALPYAIPADNPFVDDPGAHDEIWAYGLRNVWRFSFDRSTGDMYFADVGQNSWEEINFQPADSRGGENYGWNVWEGSHVFAGGHAPNHVPPIFEYTRNMGCSVTGGYVYRGEAVPELQAAYIFGDFCSGRIWAAWRDHDLHWQAQQVMNTDLAISSFGEDETGELYVIDYGGTLYRIDPAEA